LWTSISSRHPAGHLLHAIVVELRLKSNPTRVLPLVSASWPHLSFDIPKPHSSVFRSGIRRCLRSNKDGWFDVSLRALRGPTSQQIMVKVVDPLGNRPFQHLWGFQTRAWTKLRKN
jgi:hypothetical protein